MIYRDLNVTVFSKRVPTINTLYVNEVQHGVECMLSRITNKNMFADLEYTMVNSKTIQMLYYCFTLQCMT